MIGMNWSENWSSFFNSFLGFIRRPSVPLFSQITSFMSKYRFVRIVGNGERYDDVTFAHSHIEAQLVETGHVLFVQS